MPLFGIAVLKTPSKKEREEGTGDELLFGPVWQVGKDGQAVAMKVMLDAQKEGKLPADFDLSRAEIQVSPFV
jgi:hypothetical protein